MKHCPECMKEVDPQVVLCPHCSHPVSRCPQPMVEALPVGTVVQERYELLLLQAASRQALCYAAWDNLDAQPVLIEEFFPRAAVVRRGSVQPREGMHANFEQALERMRRYAIPGKRELPCTDVFEHGGTIMRVYKPTARTPLKEQADSLLDDAILFRDPEGPPVMSINLLKIPAIPAVRPARTAPLRRVLRKRRILSVVYRLLLLLLVLSVTAIGLFAAGVLPPERWPWETELATATDLVVPIETAAPATASPAPAPESTDAPVTQVVPAAQAPATPAPTASAVPAPQDAQLSPSPAPVISATDLQPAPEAPAER